MVRQTASVVFWARSSFQQVPLRPLTAQLVLLDRVMATRTPPLNVSAVILGDIATVQQQYPASSVTQVHMLKLVLLRVVTARPVSLGSMITIQLVLHNASRVRRDNIHRVVDAPNV